MKKKKDLKPKFEKKGIMMMYASVYQLSTS